MALFTSILAFAGSVTNALATAAAPKARRDFCTSGSGALDGLRAAAEATRTNKQCMLLSDFAVLAVLARHCDQQLCNSQRPKCLCASADRSRPEWQGTGQLYKIGLQKWG